MSDKINYTNLELRDSRPDGTQGAGLTHNAEGMVLLTVRELAADGEPEGAVAVLHDAGDHGGRYEQLGGALSAASWAVSLPDLRGHGKSEGVQGNSWGYPEVERDINDVLDHLGYMAPTSPKALIGVGLGALHALAYALANPRSLVGVVAIAPVLDPSFEAPRKKGGLMGMFSKLGPTSPGAIGWSLEQRFADAGARSAWAADAEVHDVVTARAIESYTETAARVRSGASGIQVPALVLVGENDPLSPPAAAQALAGDQLEVRSLAGRGHDLVHDAAALETQDAIVSWLGARVG